MCNVVLIHTPETQEVRLASEEEQESFFSNPAQWVYQDELIGLNDTIVGHVGIYE